MKYLALIMLLSSIFVGSASAHMYRFCNMGDCPGGVVFMGKDKAQNFMYHNKMFGDRVIFVNPGARPGYIHHWGY